MKSNLLKHIILGFFLITVLFAASCKKDAVNNTTLPPNTGGTTTNQNSTDTTGTLIGSAITAGDFPNIGFAVQYGTMSANAAYVAAVKREANYVTFGNELKYHMRK
jgi:endo-1,4-beta-xylanase